MSAGSLRYLVAGSKPWNRKVFDEKISKYPGQWFFVDNRRDLTRRKVSSIAPRYFFFLHWSWKVPAHMVKAYECVCFHMTNLPYGRGGSPLQNLILRGHRTTTLTAFRMAQKLDAGPIYLKEKLSLEGSAEEIYIRASHLAARMILRILQEEIEPVPQVGVPTYFKRRTPKESDIPVCSSLGKLFDFIRMLDAEEYPRAFFMHKGFRYEFSKPSFTKRRIGAEVGITLERGATP